ncbi:MAG TPA: alpha/beta hydrolase [Candidatus Limnocylindrales bacterium]|nr:alpha/beta hydrolase [Candidatus Limnocylindrales bacterium]
MVSIRPYLIAAALVYLVGTPFALDGERLDLDDRVRQGVPGRFVKLSAGHTRYDLLGPQPSQVVVLVHGFTSPSYVWGEIPGRLRDAGYRTLVYDLYGRGFSDRPDVDYDLDLYDRQLEELLAKLELSERVHLVGLSMGGVIASEFALRHGDRVASLTLIDPAGFGVDVPVQARLLALPLVGEYVLRAFGDGVLMSGNERGVHDQSLVPDLQARFAPQLAYRGYKRAILSSMRHMPLSDFRERYRELGHGALPVQIFWGRQDRVTPFEGAEVAATLLPKAHVHPVEEAGHLPHYEKPDAVAPRLLAFLAANPAPAQQGVALQGMCGTTGAHVHTAQGDAHVAVHSDAAAGDGKASETGEGAETKRGAQRGAASAERRAARPPQQEKDCRECDPRKRDRMPTAEERARRRAPSRPPAE